MNDIRSISKKVKTKTYLLEDIETALTIENQHFLFTILYEIAKEKLISDKIVDSLKKLIVQENGISDAGVGNFTVRIIACATLIKLGYKDILNQLTDEQRYWVDAILNDKMWKDI